MSSQNVSVIVSVEFCPGVVEGICEAICAAHGADAKPDFGNIRNAVKSSVSEELKAGNITVGELGDLRFDKSGKEMKGKQSSCHEFLGKATVPAKLYQFNREVAKLGKKYGFVPAVKLPEMFRVWIGEQKGFVKKSAEAAQVATV